MELRFEQYIDDEDGKLACLETIESEIPVNVHAEEDSDWTIQDGETCEVEIYAVGNRISVYPSEKDYKKSGSHMATLSMIPAGTFPLDPEDKDFQQSAHIICTGKVLEVRKEEQIKSEEEGPNYLLDVQTYELELHLYTYFEGDIQKGNIISGGMWLFGNVRKKAH